VSVARGFARIMAVDCPYCGVIAGQGCRARKGMTLQLGHYHASRVTAAFDKVENQWRAVVGLNRVGQLALSATRELESAAGPGFRIMEVTE
jgi:hypothetical protein